jgi:hypothetical protein
VKPDEARELIWLVPIKVFANLVLSRELLRLFVTMEILFIELLFGYR